MKKERSIESIIEYGIDKVPVDQSLNIKLSDFVMVYKTIEELRRFIHNSDHYPNLEVIEKYFGDRDKGIYSVLNKLYSKTLDKYVSEDIEMLLESNDLKCDSVPFYFGE